MLFFFFTVNGSFQKVLNLVTLNTTSYTVLVVVYSFFHKHVMREIEKEEKKRRGGGKKGGEREKRTQKCTGPQTCAHTQTCAHRTRHTHVHTQAHVNTCTRMHDQAAGPQYKVQPDDARGQPQPLCFPRELEPRPAEALAQSPIASCRGWC